MSFNSETQINLDWKKLANDQLKENDFLANKLDKLIHENECYMYDLYNARHENNTKTYQIEEMLKTINILEQDNDKLLQNLQKITNEKKAFEQELNKRVSRNYQGFINILIIYVICSVLYKIFYLK